jgi:hypothetical protein
MVLSLLHMLRQVVMREKGVRLWRFGFKNMLRILSLGAGVQSTTLALMAARGEIDSVDHAVFADTGSEPSVVYRHLAWLETVIPFPVHRVSVGNLGESILSAMKDGQSRIDARPPFFTSGGGMLNRQCTGDYKIMPIQRKVRELAGIARGSRGPKTVVVEQLIGISTDEAGRMKDSRFRWLRHCFPLIELGLSRAQCLLWLAANSYPTPPKSACTFCPYHDDRMWRDMKLNDPESFAEAVRVDEAIRPGMAGPRRPEGTTWYLHRNRIPLRLVDFSTAEDRGQINMFNEECEGMCGV